MLSNVYLIGLKQSAQKTESGLNFICLPTATQKIISGIYLHQKDGTKLF
jgi:hypothetical protein